MKWLSNLIQWWLGLFGVKSPKKKPSDIPLHGPKVEHLREEDQTETDIETAAERAKTWRNRALMARQHGNRDLEKVALERMWQYQVAAARMEGKEPPPEPPLPGDPLDDYLC